MKSIYELLGRLNPKLRSPYYVRKLPLYAYGYLYYGMLKPNRGIFIMEEDWDNLIVLDACRHDLFEEVIGAKVDYKISRASDTGEFVEENFVDRQFSDTVMISGNPRIDRRAEDSFYKIIPVWKDGWNEELNTVLPQTLYESALKNAALHPDKRLIAWFMQPHFPFINNPELSLSGLKRLRQIATYNDSLGKVAHVTPWEEAEKGNLNIKDVWAAYKKNLEAVIPYALNLAEELKGKTVITSDHGNAFRRIWIPFPIMVAGHPHRIHIPELVTVPWMVFDSSERRLIVNGEDNKSTTKARIKKLRKSGRL